MTHAFWQPQHPSHQINIMMVPDLPWQQPCQHPHLHKTRISRLTTSGPGVRPAACGMLTHLSMPHERLEQLAIRPHWQQGSHTSH